MALTKRNNEPKTMPTFLKTEGKQRIVVPRIDLLICIEDVVNVNLSSSFMFVSCPSSMNDILKKRDYRY